MDRLKSIRDDLPGVEGLAKDLSKRGGSEDREKPARFGAEIETRSFFHFRPIR